MSNVEIFGEYDTIPEGIDAEGVLTLYLQPIDLMTYWKRCGLIADFSARFYAFAHTGANEIVENTLSTVLNELVENAAKFSRQKESRVHISLKHYINLVAIEITNEASLQIGDSFKEYVQKLLKSDHDKMYVEKMENKTEDDMTSGMGLLMILMDYNSKLGVKFETIEENGAQFYRVHVQILLRLED